MKHQKLKEKENPKTWQGKHCNSEALSGSCLIPESLQNSEIILKMQDSLLQ